MINIVNSNKDMGETSNDDVHYSNPNYEFDPVTFLKCHSRIKGDKNDRITKVWMCAFEPHCDYPEKTTNLVATCGSNSVCVMNVKTGEVILKHYSKHNREDFYSVSWSTVYMTEKEGGKKIKSNILAVAGARCTVHLLHPSKAVCFLEETYKRPSDVSISSLQFHPSARPLLCGAFSNGEVYLWDIGTPSIPDYGVSLTHIRTLSIESEIFNMSFSRHCQCLLAATDNGVVAWALDLKDLHDSKTKIKTWRFNFLKKEEIHGNDAQLVDSVEPIQNGKIVASKCALYGKIFLWDIEEGIESCRQGGNVTIQPAHTLNYSKTDNYFMSMGSSLLSGLLACGDDEGNIWLYDLKEILSQSLKKQEQSAVIPWPDVEDITMQWMIKQNEVVINKVVVNHNGSYIVAVTNTNLVCIWKKERA